ncbi:MAG: thiamine pyrophosphate-binding protein [Acidobacteria bacterium]|nr:2-oxoacid:acceptor oxidoreductase family protein [Thermoanaerobaculia bacterium]MDI9630647.1 2-oxoacid:acceptor oxidoreductase family protein [Acidobacteriota bacterium]MBP7813287.1 2-oxoacid:acceptor oxidoreductase family protein [Thermoanaerobaculia bacterium]MBP8844347.1 2-oxoacid:acceptor oxidoreductase family protein [Thermoanaerobaculia bacterium]NLN10534.1 thiamine pyrophosphate-binding protein [Acidobacteriota bacterium]
MTTTVFYDRFERHAQGQGIKGHSTHYCPGCGHGLAHKYLAEAIDELGIQDRVVAVSPVGCSVFLYYYMDVGNTQAAHGRAPVVAIGHKTANPDSIVISYQGDGDLASIGLAEIVSTAQLGIPISVIFINNAVYGMTGGQMAPTTLMGMKTATSPAGRTPLMGQPLRMAEMIAGLQGPVYVERVALYDAKQRTRAKRAIRKALECQVENKGFSFVEVLAECPTHLRLDPVATEKWVAEQMTQIFPLGLMKDVTKDASFPALPRPSFSEERLLEVVGASMEEVSRFATSFPSHLAKGDVALKLAGAGGDGAQTAAMLITNAAINEGFDSTHIPSYGPESRGGTSYADVHVAEREVLSPAAPNPHLLVAFNAPSLAKFGPAVQPGGVVVYDSSTIHSVPELPAGVTAHGVPFTQIAADLGRTLVKNVVALGALQEATQLFPKETFLYAIRNALKEKCAMIPLNEEAFAWGARAVRGN